jgi:cytoskeleton protein RodZ
LFEIGSTLRDARLRLGLELEDVARATRVSARILAALETEAFERIAGDFYARSYLRTYAEFLGLDSRRFLDEYRERFGEREPLAIPRRSRRRVSVPGKRLLIVALIGAGTAALFLAFGSQQAHREPLVTPPPAPAKALRPQPRSREVPAHVPNSPRAAPTLGIVAARGDCWLQVRAGSAQGPILYEATLQKGHAISFRRRFLWVRLGAPASADVRVHGKLVPGLTTLAPMNLLVGPRGASSA